MTTAAKQQGMLARLMRPEAVWDKYGEGRHEDDDLLPSTRYDVLKEREWRHLMSSEAGGPAYTRSNGYAWAEERGEYEGRAGRYQRELDRKEFQLMEDVAGSGRLTMIGGPRGSGKTLFAVMIAGILYDGGYIPISNLGLDFGYQFFDAANLLTIIRSPYNSVWVVDELHVLLNKMAMSRRFNREAVAGLTGLRKRRTGLIGPTSQIGNVDTMWAAEAKYAVMMMLERRPPPGGSLRKRRSPRDEEDWLNTWGILCGPYPLRNPDDSGSFLLAGLNVKSKSWQRVGWMPNEDKLLFAAHCYNSFEDTPDRKQGGHDLDSAKVSALNFESGLGLVDVLDFGDPTQADDDATEEERYAAINTLLGDVLHVIQLRQLRGRQRLSALRSAVTVALGTEYEEGLFQDIMQRWGGASGQFVQVEDIFMALGLDETGNPAQI